MNLKQNYLTQSGCYKAGKHITVKGLMIHSVGCPQAETVRRIYDLYLAGNGYHKIMKQLEKEGRRTAMGKTMWHYATVGHILKNRLYCGELEYRKEYVPDYLEQKRVKNNGELDRIMVCL